MRHRLTSEHNGLPKRSAETTYVEATFYISPYALIVSSPPALPTTQLRPTKSLHPQSLGPKFPGGWGAGRPRSRLCAAGSAEIRPTEPGRACPAKGVRYHRVDHHLVVSPEDRHHRRGGHGVGNCLAAGASRLLGVRLGPCCGR